MERGNQANPIRANREEARDSQRKGAPEVLEKMEKKKDKEKGHPEGVKQDRNNGKKRGKRTDHQTAIICPKQGNERKKKTSP